jgi:hypothetical protein
MGWMLIITIHHYVKCSGMKRLTELSQQRFLEAPRLMICWLQVIAGNCDNCRGKEASRKMIGTEGKNK